MRNILSTRIITMCLLCLLFCCLDMKETNKENIPKVFKKKLRLYSHFIQISNVLLPKHWFTIIKKSFHLYCFDDLHLHKTIVSALEYTNLCDIPQKVIYNKKYKQKMLQYNSLEKNHQLSNTMKCPNKQTFTLKHQWGFFFESRKSNCWTISEHSLFWINITFYQLHLPYSDRKCSLDYLEVILLKRKRKTKKFCGHLSSFSFCCSSNKVCG